MSKIFNGIKDFFGLGKKSRKVKRNKTPNVNTTNKTSNSQIMSSSRVLPPNLVILPHEEIILPPVPKGRMPGSLLYEISLQPNLQPEIMTNINRIKLRRMKRKLRENSRKTRKIRGFQSPLRSELIIPESSTILDPNNYMGPIDEEFNSNGNTSPTMEELIQQLKNFEKIRSRKR